MSPAAAAHSGRVLVVLVAMTGALIAAFVVAPRLLANSVEAGFSDENDLRRAFRAAFVEYWQAGNREFTADLAKVVDYWYRYHLVKAVLAAILLAVLVTLTVKLWRAFMAAGQAALGTRVGLAVSGGLAAVLALCSLVLVLANMQGAVTPFASLLPMLLGEDSAPTEVITQVDRRLADGTRVPPLEVMIDEFARYHVAMAALAAVTAVLLLGACALLWRTSVRSPDRRSRRVLAWFGALSALLALIMVVVAVANTTNASNPVPGLAALFTNGW
ncbi:hypothetical protein [Nocardia salmonicida]|uniref:hypothetical protein n=1 Tax=Nocardia salmonicida TaxID=53431 RepID=UPI000B2BD8B8|nr:hypothetical protein [Nocardia salmonicida]